MLMLVDFDQVMYTNFILYSENHEVQLPLIRHMVLNCLRSYKSKFDGQLILTASSQDTWRRDIFPLYKASRKTQRETSALDWHAIFEAFSTIKNEIAEYFPYPFIRVARTEADDIIATIVRHNPEQRFIILSSDKDFIQLHRPGVTQFDPVRSKSIEHPHPAQFLIEQVLKGDRTDGVPNVLSADDCIVKGIRQTTMTAKRLQILQDAARSSELDTLIDKDLLAKRIQRNRALIDLSQIPLLLEQEIIAQFRQQCERKPDKQMLANYMRKHKLVEMLAAINEF